MKHRLSQIVVTCVAGLLVACTSVSSPSQVATNFINYVDTGNIDEAAKLLSTNFVSKMGGASETKSRLKGMFFDPWKDAKSNGKMEKLLSVSINREDVAGGLAEVAAEANIRGHYRGRADVEDFPINFSFKFVKESEEWKIDSIFWAP